MKLFKSRKVKESVISTLTQLLNDYAEELRIAKHNNEILLEHSEELRAKIQDLENNIEFLVNNSHNETLKELRGE